MEKLNNPYTGKQILSEMGWNYDTCETRVKKVADFSAEKMNVIAKELFNQDRIITKPKREKPFDFNQNLKVLCDIPGKNQVLPVLDNVLLTKDGMLTSTNLEVYYHLKTEILNHNVLIPIKILRSIGKNEKLVDIEYGENGEIFLITDKKKIQFAYNGNMDDFPKMVKYHVYHQFDFTKEDIETAKIQSKFPTKDELRPVMQSVCFDKHIAATDAHRLKWDKSTSDFGGHSFLINSAYIKYLFPGLCSLFCAFEYKEVKYRTCSFVKIEDDSKIIYIRCTEGKYPNWEAVIPKESELVNKIIVSSEKMKTALKELIPFANKVTNKIELKFKEGEKELQMRAEDLDFGNLLNLSISAEVLSGEIHIAVNGKLFLSMFETFDSVQPVLLKFSQANKAICMNDNMLIMPVMIKDY